MTTQEIEKCIEDNLPDPGEFYIDDNSEYGSIDFKWASEFYDHPTNGKGDNNLIVSLNIEDNTFSIIGFFMDEHGNTDYVIEDIENISSIQELSETLNLKIVQEFAGGLSV